MLATSGALLDKGAHRGGRELVGPDGLPPWALPLLGRSPLGRRDVVPRLHARQHDVSVTASPVTYVDKTDAPMLLALDHSSSASTTRPRW
jgi:hypothetical protein